MSRSRNSRRYCLPGAARVAAFAIALVAGSVSAHAVPGRYAECAGHIIDASGADADFNSLVDKVKNANFILFGERHGVRQQAVASACIMSALNDNARPVALVMEMFSTDDDRVIERYRTIHPESPAGLGVALEWWKRGWPAFDNWHPLIDRAFSLRVPIAGGDLAGKDSAPRKLNQREVRQLRARLGNAEPAIRKSWHDAMATAHCEMLSDEATDVMAGHQMRRDQSIAKAADDIRTEGGAVLVEVGRGHSRKDRSLYRLLSGSAEAAGSVISVGAFATGEEVRSDDLKAHDFIWLAGEAQTQDPCLFAKGNSFKSGDKAARQ